jgi:hypothetical protein
MGVSDLTLNILGFPAVNRDLTVEVRDPISNALVREVQPFLDGTVRVPSIAAGAYEVRVRHPNLALPVLRRPIRVLPTGDTKVSLVIDPSQFRDTPIEDIPDANLAPVRQMAESVAETLLPLAAKQPGEAIKSQDWNALVGGIRDVALAIAELTRLITPTGHNHPEFERKFDEMTSNFETLVNTISAALTELQRQIQSGRFRRQVEEVLDAATIDRTSPRGRELLDLMDELDQTVTEPPAAFGRKARNVGVQLSTRLESLIDENPDLASSDQVTALATSLDLLKSQRTMSYGAELEHNRRVDRTIGGSGLRQVIGR